MPMRETRSDRTLMALLEPDLEDSDRTPVEAGQAERLPSLDERIDMFLRAVHGPEAEFTAEERSAARERILAAMAVDLAETTMGAAPGRNAAAPEAPGLAAEVAGRAAAGWSEIRSKLVQGFLQLVSPAGEVFAMRAVRMAAVPLLALLVVGSIWTGTWIADEHPSDRGNQVPGSSPAANAPTTRGLEAPAERDFKREIAAAEAARGPLHPDVANRLVDLADFYRAQRRYQEAENLYNRALTIQQRALGPRHPDVMRTITALADVYRAEGRAKDAEALLRRTDQP
jgi:tetratricopeptide (TPR) repeat protein